MTPIRHGTPISKDNQGKIIYSVLDDIKGDNYSGGIKSSMHLTFLFAGLNRLDLLMADICSACLYAVTVEKVYNICRMEFRAELQGYNAVIRKNLYGLKPSAAGWHKTLSDYLWSLGFRKPSRSDTDLWY